ncbi:helix-turn-helix domain-containing protein [Methylocystis sp. IM3]|uniref:helix-turn-helix domain-containing protein n=1 Tax=unclassified Methylocystis TaxID=2625913 RepID=UPI0030F84563
MDELTFLTDQAGAPALLNSRRPRLYRLKGGALHLARACLAFGCGVSIQEIRLLGGGLRIDGRIAAGALKIVFVKAEEIRLLGARVSGEAVALACGGGALHLAANLPASALSIHFSPAAVQRIVAQATTPELRRRLEAPLDFEPLLSCVTPSARALEKSARRLLAGGESGEENLARRPPPPEWDAMVGLSADLLREADAVGRTPAPRGARRRRRLALTIENLLWEAPHAGESRRLSLEDAARRLRCSRRSIQLAVQEEFGLGFVELKRAIRLHQVHAALRRERCGPYGVGRIAKAHEFNHLGRFAGHYREMFGVLPSVDLPGGAGSRAGAMACPKEQAHMGGGLC